MDLDLRPRVVLEPPGGAIVIDPFGDVGAGTLNAGGIAIPWRITFGTSELPPPSGLLSTRIELLLAAGLVLGGLWLLSR